jgi:hypothetical protein
MIKTEFKHGEEVKVHGFLVRIKGANGLRIWERFPSVSSFKAIFLGGRKLVNGKMEYEDYGKEGGCNEFHPSEYLDGALVCEKNRNPIKVLLNDVEKIK